MSDNVYQRADLLSALLRWRDRDLIKVVTGIRRSGKSVVMQMARQAILESGIGENRVAFVDFESRAAAIGLRIIKWPSR